MKKEKVSKAWLIKRSAWQAVSDIMSGNIEHYEENNKESFLNSCITCIFSGFGANIDEFLYKIQFLTYSLLSGLFKK